MAFQDDPRRVELERRLLELGGTLALLFLPDPLVGELLERGQGFPGAGARMWPGFASECHANAGMLLVASGGRARIASGYALSADGLWRQHSWGIDVGDGRILETTDRRVRYYGYVLNDTEAAIRLLGMMRSGDLWPEEVEAVRRFLESVHGPIPAALLAPAR